MNYKRIILLCISAFLLLSGYAQDIREVNVEKPGKLGKLVKKELATISKLKVTGTLNCEDVNVLSQMPMLEYLDLWDISFDYDDKHNDPVCMSNKSTFYLHAPIGKLREFFAPKSAKKLSLTNYKDQTILFKKNIRKDEINYYKHNYYAYGSPYKSILENVFVHIPFGCIIDTPIKVVRIDGDPCQEYAEEFLKGLNKVEEKLVFDKVKTANALYPNFSLLEVPIIFVEEAQWLHVNKWEGNSITKEQLKKIDSFRENSYHYEYLYKGGFFSDLKLPNDIELSDRVKVLPEYFMYGHNEVTSIILPEGLKEIGLDAIPGSVTRIKIPATVKSIGKGYLDVDTIELVTQMPPEWLKEFSSSFRLGDEHKSRKHHFVIPDGTLKEYYAFRDDLIYIDNAPGGSYKINVPKGNTILSYISLIDLMMADSLTVSGILHEQDFEFIRKARKLKYLDISQCFTSYSEELLKQYQQKRNAMSAIFRAISNKLDDQYNDYQMGTFDYKANKFIADEISKAYSTGKLENTTCIIPHEALKDMPALEHLKLPILCASISEDAFEGCKRLKRVELPPYLINIDNGAFCYCHNLEDIHFPQSLKVIERHAFYNCLGLEKIDLSNLKLTHLGDKAFAACAYLTELILPEGLKEIGDQTYKNNRLKKIVFPSTATKVSMSNRDWDEDKAVPCEFHFKSKTPPQGDFSKSIFGDEATIFIPKGTVTVYTTKFGTRLKFVEE